VARVFLPRPATVLVDDVKHEAAAPTAERELRIRSGLGGYSLFRSTDTGWRLNPNIRMIIRNHQLSQQNIEIRTNALGYRGDDIPEKTDKDFRILVLGDSVTLADYAPEDGTYPAYAERRLAQLGPAAKKVRVINAGTSSIDLRSEFMILMETGLQTKPDVVVEGLYLNDADVSFTLNAVTYPPHIRWSRFLTFLMSRTSYLRTALQVRARQQDRKEELKEFVAAHPVAKEGDWHESDGAFNREIVEAFGDWGYAWTNDAWQKMEETLTLMKQVVADHDADFLVVLLPVRQQVEAKALRNEPQQQFEKVARRLGLPHLDLLPVLRERFAADKHDLFYDHCHLRPEGNEIVGRAIADALAKESSKVRGIGIVFRGDAAGTAASLAPAANTGRLPELLNRPLGVAVAPNGELLIVDGNENAIQRVSPDGHFLGHLGTVAFKQPNGLAFAGNGTVYVADTWNQRVVRLSADGTPIDDLPAAPDGGFYAPRDVAIAPEGDVFVANTGRSRIERYDGGGKITNWGKAGEGNGEFHEPLGVLVAGREVYVADYGNARIQVFSYEGRLLRSFAVSAWQKASMGYRPAMAFFRDRLYVSDTQGSSILIYGRRGEERGRLRAPEIVEPTGLAISKSGTLYIANQGNGMVAAVDLTAKGELAVRPFAPAS
jgi:sugar lactone lactonase YvrE/lysophospholipase L1-like esterase